MPFCGVAGGNELRQRVGVLCSLQLVPSRSGIAPAYFQDTCEMNRQGVPLWRANFRIRANHRCWRARTLTAQPKREALVRKELAMVNVRVKGGTAIEGASLCVTCSWGVVRRGFSATEEEAFCRMIEPNARVPFKVRECTAYADRRVPSLYFMEKSAWVLLTKTAGRGIGFVSGAEFREIEGENAEMVPRDERKDE